MPRPPISSRSTATPAATARLIAKGGNAKIGRVAVMPDYRGTGLGRDLMVHILTHAKEIGFTESAIEAQVTVIPFYARLGYVAEGPNTTTAPASCTASCDSRSSIGPERRRAVRESRSDRKAAQPQVRKQDLRLAPNSRSGRTNPRFGAQNPCTCDISALMRAFVP
jgi:N-acetylglutamate synthase-like GNAT family acetyltransferase